MKAIAVAFAAMVLAFPGTAQDTRKVGEPSIPPACMTLPAKIGRAATSIAPEDESPGPAKCPVS